MPDTSLPDNAVTSIVDSIDKANARIAEQFPGDSPARQPVHTVYGGAHLFKADAAQKLGALALKSLQDHAPDASSFAAATVAWLGSLLLTYATSGPVSTSHVFIASCAL